MTLSVQFSANLGFQVFFGESGKSVPRQSFITFRNEHLRLDVQVEACWAAGVFWFNGRVDLAVGVAALMMLYSLYVGNTFVRPIAVIRLIGRTPGCLAIQWWNLKQCQRDNIIQKWLMCSAALPGDSGHAVHTHYLITVAVRSTGLYCLRL